MAVTVRTGLPRWLMAAMAIFFWMVVASLATAQQVPMPEAPPHSNGEQDTVAQLATSDWTQEDLNTWWAALRAMDGGGSGQFLNALPAKLQPPTDPAAWHSVRLPDVRPRETGKDFPETPKLQMRWYRLRYAPPDGKWPTSVALYMPRLVSLASAVMVRTDDGWRPVFDNQSGAREQWVRPLWAVFPAAVTELRKDQVIDVVVAAPVLQDSFYTASSVWIGAREELEPRYQRRWALQIGVPQATGMTLAVLGLFSFVLWLRRRGEAAYLLFSLVAAAWLLRNLHYYLDLPHTRQGLEWFWWATQASMSWVMLLSFMFTLRFSAQRHRRFEQAMWAFVLLSSVLTMPLWLTWLDTLILQQGVNALVALLGVGYVGRVAVREGSREMQVIAIGLAVGLGLGVHDLLMQAGWVGQEHIYLMPFATLIIVSSFLYAVQRRYVGAFGEVERLNVELVERLEQQGKQLQSQHDRLRDTERQQSLLVERQRLMQDMHDGLGSALLSAMVAVEQGSMDQHKVVEVLRECVDDLRLVIDSLEPVAHDLVALLATMRYRLGKRLQTGGLVLEWDVQDLPPLQWLEPPDALHVLRLMQEALTNVLKHANARRVRMVTRHYGTYVEIRVEDDGDGFDLDNAQRGRGLKSQQKRANRLGGHIHVESSPGNGTRLSLRLPVVRGGGVGPKDRAPQGHR